MMPEVTSTAPWFRRNRGWFVTVNKKQHSLGVSDPKDVAGAMLAAKKLIEELSAGIAAKLGESHKPSVQPATGPTVAECVAAFLAIQERKVAAGKVQPVSLANLKLPMIALTATHGSRAIGTLTAEELETWADRPEWSSSTQHGYLGSIQRMLKHSGITLHPPLRRPPMESRGAETMLTDKQFAAVLTEIRRPKINGKGGKDFAEFLLVLRECGARPQEIAQLRAECMDWANACARLKYHKTRKYTGADRVIHFNVKAMKVLVAQRKKYKGDGLLFRTRDGNSYSPTTIVRRLAMVSDRVGFRVIAYGLGRHSFCSRALAAGIPDAIVAAAVGHRNTDMLHKHYSHLGQTAKLLKDAAERASAYKDAG